MERLAATIKHHGISVVVVQEVSLLLLLLEGFPFAVLFCTVRLLHAGVSLPVAQKACGLWLSWQV